MPCTHHWIELEDHLGKRYRDMQVMVYRQKNGVHKGVLAGLRTLHTMFLCKKCGEHEMKPVDVFVSANGVRW